MVIRSLKSYGHMPYGHTIIMVIMVIKVIKGNNLSGFIFRYFAS